MKTESNGEYLPAREGDGGHVAIQNLSPGLNVGLFVGDPSPLQTLRPLKSAILYADHVHIIFPYSLTDLWMLKLLDRDHKMLKERDHGLLEEIELSLDSGYVSLEDIRTLGEDTSEGTFPFVSKGIFSLKRLVEGRDLLPMFDEMGGKMVTDLLERGRINVERTKKPYEHNAALGAELMSRLPLLDAPMDELLDIRTELNPYVASFRAAMCTFAADIESEPWDKDFTYDVNQVFVEKIGPAVQEIEAVVKGTRPIAKLLAAAGSAWPAAGGTSLAVAIGHLQPIVAGIAGALAGGAITASKAYDSIRTEQQKAESNQLYMYYKASKM